MSNKRELKREILVMLFYCQIVRKWLHCTYCELDVITAFLHRFFIIWWWLFVFYRNVPVGSWTRKLSRPFTHSSSLKEVQVVSYKSLSALTGLTLCFHISSEFICSSVSSACEEWSVWHQIEVDNANSHLALFVVCSQMPPCTHTSCSMHSTWTEAAPSGLRWFDWGLLTPFYYWVVTC